MKITRSRLKKIIKEQLTKVLNENLDADEKKEKANLKNKKDKTSKDKKKLKALHHQWMEEGKLSSALRERYGINKENAVGKVLWHSLNERAQIGVYDMKFGDTIVRNLLSEDIEPVLVKEHQHAKRDDDDLERGTEWN